MFVFGSETAVFWSTSLSKYICSKGSFTSIVSPSISFLGVKVSYTFTSDAPYPCRSAALFLNSMFKIVLGSSNSKAIRFKSSPLSTSNFAKSMYLVASYL